MAVDTAQIEATVRGMISDVAGLDAGDIKADDRLMEDLGLDSLQNMELLSRLSEHYEIDPDMDDVNDVLTVAQVVTFLLSYLEPKA